VTAWLKVPAGSVSACVGPDELIVADAGVDRALGLPSICPERTGPCRGRVEFLRSVGILSATENRHAGVGSLRLHIEGVV